MLDSRAVCIAGAIGPAPRTPVVRREYAPLAGNNRRWNPDALSAEEFAYRRPTDRGMERLDAICDDVLSLPVPKRAAFPEFFRLMERLSDSDLGSPGPPCPHDGEICRGVPRSACRVAFAKADRAHCLDGEPHPKMRRQKIGQVDGDSDHCCR